MFSGEEGRKKGYNGKWDFPFKNRRSFVCWDAPRIGGAVPVGSEDWLFSYSTVEGLAQISRSKNALSCWGVVVGVSSVLRAAAGNSKTMSLLS